MNSKAERLRFILENEGISMLSFLQILKKVTGVSRTRQWLHTYLKTDAEIPDIGLQVIEYLGYNREWYKSGEGEMRLALENPFFVPFLDLAKTQSELNKMSYIEIEKLDQDTDKFRDLLKKNLEIKKLLEN